MKRLLISLTLMTSLTAYAVKIENPKNLNDGLNKCATELIEKEIENSSYSDIRLSSQPSKRVKSNGSTSGVERLNNSIYSSYSFEAEDEAGDLFTGDILFSYFLFTEEAVYDERSGDLVEPEKKILYCSPTGVASVSANFLNASCLVSDSHHGFYTHAEISETKKFFELRNSRGTNIDENSVTAYDSRECFLFF